MRGQLPGQMRENCKEKLNSVSGISFGVIARNVNRNSKWEERGVQVLRDSNQRELTEREDNRNGKSKWKT